MSNQSNDMPQFPNVPGSDRAAASGVRGLNIPGVKVLGGQQPQGQPQQPKPEVPKK